MASKQLNEMYYELIKLKNEYQTLKAAYNQILKEKTDHVKAEEVKN